MRFWLRVFAACGAIGVVVWVSQVDVWCECQKFLEMRPGGRSVGLDSDSLGGACLMVSGLRHR